MPAGTDVRRSDWLIQCVARVVCAVCGFNPLAWLAWKQLRVTAEHACDDEVIRDGDVCGYAKQLVALADRLTMGGSVGVPAMARSGDLAVRVRAVLDVRRHRGRAGRLPVAAVAVSAVLVAVTIAPLRVIRPTRSEQSAASPMLAFAELQTGIDLGPFVVSQIAAPEGQSRRPELKRPHRPSVTSDARRFQFRINGPTERVVVRPSPRLRDEVHRAMTETADDEPPAMRVLAIVRGYGSEQPTSRIPRVPLREPRP